MQQQAQQTANELKEARAQHQATAKQFSLTLAEKDQQLASLEHQIMLLLKRIRGSRQERINPDQLLLFSLKELKAIAEELEQDTTDEEPSGDASNADDSGGKGSGKRGRKGKRKPGRIGPLPAHLKREILRHELPPSQLGCACCGGVRVEIGSEVSEQLEYIPARLKVLEHHRIKYVCKACEANIVIADKPPQPIEKGLPGPGLCAHAVLGKFGDHQPLYRQEDIHSRLGYNIRRSTLCGWQASLAGLARAFVLRMKYLLLQSKVIHTDDTSIKMLIPGGTQTCKFWPYLGDWLHPYAVYDFTLSRERDGPQNFLTGYEGYLQADAYSGYDCIYAGNKVTEVACVTHARRYWHQAIDNDPLRANVALGFIARLYQIETQLSKEYPRLNLQGERDFAAVAAGRQKYSLPILHEYKAWLDSESSHPSILPKSPIRAAFTYTLNQWDALCRYTAEGFLSMDNNAAERLVKIPAIGRRNYLFVGSPRGGHGAALMYSLVSSAKANGVEPFAWLRELFTRLPYHRDGEAFKQASAGEPVSSTELDYLLPDKWLEQNPSHRWTIDEIRRQEREQKRPSRPKRRRK
ncbi:MAG: IS66 family transposase [Planctomycetales bacterium]|nr:IS66 family transposase [Planctomycetales bacterium]